MLPSASWSLGMVEIGHDKAWSSSSRQEDWAVVQQSTKEKDAKAKEDKEAEDREREKEEDSWPWILPTINNRG